MPTLILFNGKIHGQPAATAIAIRGKKILAVQDDATIRALAHPHTRQINLQGRLVLPGLTDAHFHFYDWSLGRRDLELAGTKSLDELLAALKARVDATPTGAWIKGHGWNESEWPNPVMPTRHDLDSVSPNHPVILWRADLHAAVVNSRGLQAARIAANYPNPPRGVIERDSTGQLTGILKELAIDLVKQHIPTATEAEAQQAMHDGMLALHRLGITGLHDQRIMSGTESERAWQVYQHLETQGALKVRLTSNIHYSQLSNAIARGLKSGAGSNYLRFGAVKMFSDGSMGAHTAWMLVRYEDKEGGFGMAAMPMVKIAEIVRQASKHGWAVSIHAIGDRANREVLNILAETISSTPTPAFPHRIEHAQLLHPHDLVRFGKLGITASMQPVHLLDDMIKMARVWGKRSRCAFAFKCLLDTGAHLAFGSDAPVADPNPWLGIHAAVNRRKPTGEPAEGYFPTERISVAQAVHAYTLANAVAVGWQDKLGSITPGKWADLVVLDRDIYTIEPMDLANTQALMTIFDGEIVYSDERW